MGRIFWSFHRERCRVICRQSSADEHSLALALARGPVCYAERVNDRRLVYSSDEGRVKSGPPPRQHEREAAAVPEDGIVRLFRERGKRGGKTVTVIRGLPQRELEARALELKRLCGAGGTTRDGAIEIQGEHRERIAGRLGALGFRVKLAGG
jgi:translation initiation factor 1